MHGSRHRGSLATGLVAAAACVVLAGCAGGRGPFEPILFTGSTEPAVIRAMEAFFTRLGEPRNGSQLGPLPFGSREIGFDHVPVGLTNNNSFPGNYYNVNDTRGVVITTPGTGLRVSTVDFTDVNPTYASQLSDFLAPGSFAAVGSNVFDVHFQVPGSSGATAGVRGFGLVFSDVDSPSSSSLEFFDEGNHSLGRFAAPVSTDGRRASYLAAYFPDNRVTRVRVTAGTAAPAPGVNDISNGGTQDVVIVDSMAYDEPQPIN